VGRAFGRDREQNYATGYTEGYDAARFGSGKPPELRPDMTPYERGYADGFRAEKPASFRPHDTSTLRNGARQS